jgi:hypothetical protein
MNVLRVVRVARCVTVSLNRAPWRIKHFPERGFTRVYELGSIRRWRVVVLGSIRRWRVVVGGPPTISWQPVEKRARWGHRAYKLKIIVPL